jgi:hypothetical protein
MTARFQHKLWGYELTYPDDWAHRSMGEVEGFAARPEALDAAHDKPQSGHLLVRAAWNGVRQPVEALWEAHIGRVASMVVGAKKVGSAPWTLAGASGFEAEIVLPKKEQSRLWVGFLSRETTLLEFMVAHPLEERSWFEPQVTEILKSLHFSEHVDGLAVHEWGIPLPPDCEPIEPTEILKDIPDPTAWQTFDSPHSIGGLQAFYAREAPHYGWTIETFQPFPGQHTLGFARLRLRQGERLMALGLLPYQHAPSDPELLGRIAFKTA